MKKYIIQLGVLSVFWDASFIVPRRTFAVDFYDYYVFYVIIIFYYLFTRQKFNLLPSWFLKGLLVFLLGSFAGAILTNHLAFPLWKQVIGILFSGSAFFVTFTLAEFDVFRLFKYYLNISFIAACIAIFEEFAHLAGIHYKSVFLGVGGLYRVSGLSGEPYFLATVLIPSMFYFINRAINPSIFPKALIKKEKIKAIVVASAFTLTFSSSGVLALLLMIIWAAYYKGFFNSYRIVFLPVLAGLIIYLINIYKASDQNFQRRFDDGITAISGVNEASDIADFNSSSFSLTSNYLIMQASFASNPVFGIGIGNYEFVYNKYFDELFGEAFREKYLDQNAKDGNSMMIRLIAETGIWGTLIFIFFVIRFFSRYRQEKNQTLKYLTLINHGIFILLLIRLMRTGNYLGQGFFFIFFLYYYTCKLSNTVKIIRTPFANYKKMHGLASVR